METRAIVYSYNRRADARVGLNNLYHYDEMLYSVSTVRKYNKNIPIYIYLSPQFVMEYTDTKIDKLFENVNIIYFDNTFSEYDKWPEKYIRMEYWHCLQHRWKNAMNCIIENNFDRILFLDSDTILHDDVNNLFEIYSDENSFYALDDCTYHILEKLKVTHPTISFGMNDGQFILSKKIANKLFENFFDTHRKIIIDLLENSAEILTESEHTHLHWLAGQYALYLLLETYQIPYSKFDIQHVQFSTQPDHNDTSKLILHHYFSGNRHKYLKYDFNL